MLWGSRGANAIFGLATKMKYIRDDFLSVNLLFWTTYVRYTPNLEEIKLDRSGRAQSRRLKDTGFTKNRARTDPAAAADDDGGVPHVDYGLGLNLLTGGRRGEDRNLIPTRAYVPTTCTVRYTYDVLMHFAAWIISSRRTKQPRRDWK